MRFPRAAAAAAALLLPLLAAAPAARADVTVTSLLGFDGGSSVGCTTPIRLEVSSSEPAPVRCRIRVSPARGDMVGRAGFGTETEVFLAPGARKRLTVPVLSGAFSFDGEWRIRIETDVPVLLRHGTSFREGRSLEDAVGAIGAGQAVPATPLDSSLLTVGVLGAPSGGLQWLGDLPEEPVAGFVEKRQWRGTRLLAPGGRDSVTLPSFGGVDAAAAPDSWLCYEGFDALLWIDPDPDAMKDAAELDAVLGHAAHGGILVVALTPGSRVPAGSPLARAIPATLLGHDDAPADAIVAGLAGGAARGAAGKNRVPLARLGEVRGRVLRTLADGRPLVVAADHGLGTVVLLAFDPRELSSSGIQDRAAILLAVFGRAAGPAPEEEGYQQTNLTAVVGHLRKRFMTPPPLGLLVLGLAVYVLAIGPVDYFVLKRRGRLRRTVVTFPAIVAAFTLLAWGASFLLFGGAAGKARVAFLDFATSPAGDADVVRGLDLLGSYSPTGNNLDAAWDAPRSVVAFPWLGSGSSWGGPGESGGAEGLVTLAPDGRPSVSVEVPLRSHRTVQARFSTEVPAALGGAVRRREGGAVLEVVNGLRLPVHEVHVVWGDRVAVLGEMAAGDRVEVPLDGAAASWRSVGGLATLPTPIGGQWSFFGDADAFAPRGDGEEDFQAARVSMARAAAGASFASLLAEEGRTGSRMARVLARQGLDLSRQAVEGRPVVVGWCDGDPLGVLPFDGDVASSVVVVRRVLPHAEGSPAAPPAKRRREGR